MTRGGRAERTEPVAASCEWCHIDLASVHGERGRPAKFCKASHRQKAYHVRVALESLETTCQELDVDPDLIVPLMYGTEKRMRARWGADGLLFQRHTI